MSPKIKILICVVPFVIAVAVGLMYLQPAIEEMSSKGSQVDEKRTQKETLTTKLQSEAKYQSKKNAIEKEIGALRSAVPKAPDLELFHVDLERMCKESQMDLISIQPPKTDGNQPAPAPASAAKDKLKNALGAGGTAGSTATTADASRPDLEEVSRQIEVTGDYNGLMRLVHKLETYQRVIKITQLKEHIPKKDNSGGKEKKVKLPDSQAPGEGDDVGDPKQLYVSMTVTAYYLP